MRHWLSYRLLPLLTSYRHRGSWTVNSHTGCLKISPAYANQSASGPDTEDRADSEVRVDNRRSVERVKGYRVSL